MKRLPLAATILALLISARAAAWEGHDWERWREATKSERPAIESPQAGLAEPLSLLRSAGPESSRIESIKDWEAKRDRILAVLGKLLGEPSGDMKPPKPEAEVIGEADMGDYTRRHLRIHSEADDWIPAFLLVPKNLPPGPSPAMIVFHQTVAQGKDEPCGVAGKRPNNPELALALELVAQGFICLAPDAVGFGERLPEGAECYATAGEFFRKHPNWSFFGKMAWDASRIVDWMETQPGIDGRRIGVIGHSHGAYGSIMAAALEPRISAVAASCGFTFLRTDDHPERWSHLTALMPRLGFYVGDIKQAPIEWNEILATIAPRPFFNWSTTEDANFPGLAPLNRAFPEMREIYGLYGAADRLDGRLEEGRHSFPKQARDEAYRFLERHLPRRPPSPTRESIARDLGDVSLVNMGDYDLDGIARGVTEWREAEGYWETQVDYRVSPDERRVNTVSARLFAPEKPRGTGAPPGVVVFHQTSEAGKDEPAGRAGRPSMHIGVELAKRGYVVLMPDSICAGERITKSGPFDTRDFYGENPTLSAMGKMIKDGRRAITVLEGWADPKRIGVIGHSLGAEEALFVAAYDDRVKACVASCGFAPFSAEKDPGRWARDHWFSYMPRLRVDLRAGRLPAWDFDDVARLVAPRGCFVFQTSDDEIFREGEAIGPKIEALRPTWEKLGAPENLRVLIEPGPHDFSDTAKREAYAWLDSILKPESKGD